LSGPPNPLEQLSPALILVAWKLSAIGDVVDEQGVGVSGQFSVGRAAKSGARALPSCTFASLLCAFGRRGSQESRKPGRHENGPIGDGHGFVFAISGTTSATCRGRSAPRWYFVSPSCRKAKPSSGESTILKSSKSEAAIAPASTMI